MIASGLRMFTRLASPRATHSAMWCSPSSARCSPWLAAAKTSSSATTATRLATAGHEHRIFADLSFKAAAAAATAAPAGRVQHHVPELAGEALRAGDDVAVDDDAAADAHLARQIDQVVDPSPSTADVFGKAAEITVVGDPHRHVDSQPLCQQLAERDAAPQQVRRKFDETVATPDDPRHTDADACQPASGGRFRLHLAKFVDEPLDHQLRLNARPRQPVLTSRMRHASETNGGHGHGVDAQVGGEHIRGVTLRLGAGVTVGMNPFNLSNFYKRATVLRAFGCVLRRPIRE